MSPGRARRVGLAFASLLVALLAGEISLRALAHRRDLLLALESAAPAPPPGSDFSLVDLVERDPNPRIVYRLRPNLRGRFQGATLETNSIGLRGPETTVEKPDGVRRLVGLGDSILFGWGVDAEERCLEIAAASLSAEGSPVEAVNLAVVGYNTVMEVETLRERGLAFAPDVVVLAFFTNDLELPNFLWGGGESPWSLRRSFLVHGILESLRGGAFLPPARVLGLRPAEEWAEAAGRRNWGWLFPPEFEALVGQGRFLAALDELRDLAREQGFAVVALAYPLVLDGPSEMSDFFYAECGSRGFALADPRPRFHARIESSGSGPLQFHRGPKDYHPNALGHRILAETLRAALADLPAFRRPTRRTRGGSRRRARDRSSVP
jgi:lysophospholipase L1-like esterase